MLSLADKTRQIEQLEEQEDEYRHVLTSHWQRDMDRFLALSEAEEASAENGATTSFDAVHPPPPTNLQQWGLEFHATNCARFLHSQLEKDKRRQQAKRDLPLPKRAPRSSWNAEEAKAEKLRHQLRMSYVLHLDEVAKQEVEAERMRTVLHMLPTMVSNINSNSRRKS